MPFVLAVASVVAAEPPARLDNLTLEQAVQLAQENHPDLAEALALHRAAEARRGQAGSLPNPEAIVRMESAPFHSRSAHSAEYIAGVSQSIPLARRLAAEREVANHENNAAAARVTQSARELRHQVHGAYAAALFFAAARHESSNNLAAVTALAKLASARLQAGDALPADVARVEMQQLQVATEAKASDDAAKLAMAELAFRIGLPHGQIASLDGTLEEAFALASFSDVLGPSRQNPDVLAADADAAALRARVRLARAASIPDINVEMLYRRLQETRQDAFDIGLRIPLPLFSRPGARVREAQAQAESADARALSTRLGAQQALRRAVADLNRELDSATAIKQEIIPRALLVATNAEVRYKAGDASLAEVIQARRDLSAIQIRYLQQLHGVHTAWRTLALVEPANP